MLSDLAGRIATEITVADDEDFLLVQQASVLRCAKTWLARLEDEPVFVVRDFQFAVLAPGSACCVDHLRGKALDLHAPAAQVLRAVNLLAGRRFPVRTERRNDLVRLVVLNASLRLDTALASSRA